MRRLALLSALAFVCLVPLSARFQPAFATPYTLTASGVWHSSDGLLDGTWQANFDVAGFDLTGTLNLIGMPGVAEGNLAGTWNLSDIGFGILFLDQELMTFNGALQGLNFVGTFDTGEFTGDWTGSLTSLRLTTAPITPVFSDTIPSLVLGHSSGSVGDIVTLVAALHTLGQAIDRIENVLSFDPATTPILSRTNGKPNCSANPVVNPASVLFEFLPQGCSGTACNQVRAVIDSLQDLGPLLDGVSLFTCKVGINPGTAAGVYNIVVSALEAFDIEDLLVEFTSVVGQISVKAKEAGAKFGCDCSIMPTSPQVPLASLLAPLAILVLRRFGTRSKRKNDDKSVDR